MRDRRLTREEIAALLARIRVMTKDQRLALRTELFGDYCTLCCGEEPCYCAPRFDE